MQLILIRHAIAQDRAEFSQKTKLEDSLRPLTLKGRKKMQKIAMQLRDWIQDVDLIVSSPYTRAKQTADIVSQIFMDKKIVEASELVPQSPPNMFLKWLKAHGKNNRKIIIVGHEPQLSAFASYLMTGKEESIFVLKKSGIACLHVDSWTELSSDTAHMLWLLQPKQID